MSEIDKEHLIHPTKGVVSIKDFICERGYKVGERKIRRLMRLMNIHTIYRKPNLSRLGITTYIKPYLLKQLKITHSNQVWSIDISYIPMRKGFMYLTAIIDVYSRFIVGWTLNNSLDCSNCIETLKQAIDKYGVPEIINSDQGSQFTSKEWIDTCKSYPRMSVSMDGKGRCKDNIWIERFWRTIKYEYIYIVPEENGEELYIGIKEFINYYNYQRHHQGIQHQTPSNLYFGQVA